MWNEPRDNMGRPGATVDDYLEVANERIRDWQSQLDKSKDPIVEKHDNESQLRLKNKISALRSRMNLKLISGTKDAAKKLAGYQTNFNRLIKYFVQVRCEGQQEVNREILTRIGSHRVAERVGCQDKRVGVPLSCHAFLHELEKLIWKIYWMNKDKQQLWLTDYSFRFD